jgi:hypothetical protein
LHTALYINGLSQFGKAFSQVLTNNSKVCKNIATSKLSLLDSKVKQDLRSVKNAICILKLLFEFENDIFEDANYSYNQALESMKQNFEHGLVAGTPNVVKLLEAALKYSLTNTEKAKCTRELLKIARNTLTAKPIEHE